MKIKESRIAFALCLLAFCFSAAFADNAPAASSAAASGSASAGNEGPQSTGIYTPFFVGGTLGFGSGTGVGTERGLGLRQIEPMVGLWYPNVAFFRAGYGFHDFTGEDGEGESTEIEHYDLDVELGVHLLGDIYAVGNYSRVKELSRVGDVAWNEWGVGVGTILSIFSRSMIFAEVGYRYVLDHFDPFLNESVSGSRVQMNFGFVAYIY